jgi:hypothetical protein
MSSATSIGLGLVAAALAGIIVMEWRVGERRDEQAPPHVSASPTGERSQQVAVSKTNDTSASIDTILARPLFTPGRRPPSQPHAEPAPTTKAALPRLAGVLVSPAGKAAIFAGGDTKPVVVHEGGRLGAYTVQSIEPGRVTLLGPGGTVVLQPTFENVTKPTSTPPHSGNAGGWRGVIVRNDHT